MSTFIFQNKTRRKKNSKATPLVTGLLSTPWDFQRTRAATFTSMLNRLQTWLLVVTFQSPLHWIIFLLQENYTWQSKKSTKVPSQLDLTHDGAEWTKRKDAAMLDERLTEGVKSSWDRKKSITRIPRTHPTVLSWKGWAWARLEARYQDAGISARPELCPTLSHTSSSSSGWPSDKVLSR